jgi:hypothetical protein
VQRRAQNAPRSLAVRPEAQVHEGDQLHLHEDDHEGGRHREQEERRRGGDEADQVDVVVDDLRDEADEPWQQAGRPADDEQDVEQHEEDEQRDDDLARQREPRPRTREERHLSSAGAPSAPAARKAPASARLRRSPASRAG